MFVLVNSHEELENFQGPENLIPLVRSHRFDHIKPTNSNLHLKIYQIEYISSIKPVTISNFLYEDITSNNDVEGLEKMFNYEHGDCMCINSIKLNGKELKNV